MSCALCGIVQTWLTFTSLQTAPINRRTQLQFHMEIDRASEILKSQILKNLGHQAGRTDWRCRAFPQLNKINSSLKNPRPFPQGINFQIRNAQNISFLGQSYIIYESSTDKSKTNSNINMAYRTTIQCVQKTGDVHTIFGLTFTCFKTCSTKYLMKTRRNIHL